MNQRIQNEKKAAIEVSMIIKIALAVATIVVVFLIVYAFSGKPPELICNIPFTSNPNC